MTTHIVEINNKVRDRLADKLYDLRNRLSSHTCIATEKDGCDRCEEILGQIEVVERELEAFEDTHYTSHD